MSLLEQLLRKRQSCQATNTLPAPSTSALGSTLVVFAALGSPERRTAALRYYRALFLPWMRGGEYAREQALLWKLPPQPLLYLHGADDGCRLPEVAARAEHVLEPPSKFAMVEGAGHFLQLERPDEVNRLVAEFL